jgi:alkaline phosphatase D
VDGSWYGGTPLWVLAEEQGMRAACLFWPASEAEIHGKRPSYYLHFDDKFPDEKRVEQVLAWLRLPGEQRPHFIALYYSNVDHAGHEFGPESAETADAVHHVDEMIGALVTGLAALHLRVNLFVVSDHGMEREHGDWITLEKYADLSLFETVGSLVYADSEADADKAYQSLRGASDSFKAYRRANLPPQLHFDANPRAGDPVVVPDGPYAIRAREARSLAEGARIPIGVHGYDPQKMPSMKAIFFASGPDIRSGVALAPFENIHVYPLIAQILGLKIGTVDGKLRTLQAVLKSPALR